MVHHVLSFFLPPSFLLVPLFLLLFWSCLPHLSPPPRTNPLFFFFLLPQLAAVSSPFLFVCLHSIKKKKASERVVRGQSRCRFSTCASFQSAHLLTLLPLLAEPLFTRTHRRKRRCVPSCHTPFTINTQPAQDVGLSPCAVCSRARRAGAEAQPRGWEASRPSASRAAWPPPRYSGQHLRRRHTH